MTQKELKAVYTEELKKAWKDEGMVKHCSKSTAYVVEHNGELYGISKPSIQTKFCFGYGYCGITTEDEENRAGTMAHHAKTNKDYFIQENLAQVNGWIDKLKKIVEQMNYNWAEGSHPVYMVVTGEAYYSQSENCRLRHHSVVNTFDGVGYGKICNDVELLEKLIAGYEQVKVDFIKRLNTYLKRYGLSKVESWSYLSD